MNECPLEKGPFFVKEMSFPALAHQFPMGKLFVFVQCTKLNLVAPPENLTAGTGSYTRGVWFFCVQKKMDFLKVYGDTGPPLCGEYDHQPFFYKGPWCDQPTNTAEMGPCIIHVSCFDVRCVMFDYESCVHLQGGSGNATHFHNTPLEEAGVAWSVYLCAKIHVSGLVRRSHWQVCFGSVGIHQCGTSSACCCGIPSVTKSIHANIDLICPT